MFGSFDSEKLAGWLGKWWFSLLLIIPVILMTEFAWTGLSVNVMLTLNYPFVFPFSFIYFLTDNLNLIIHESGHTIFGIFGWRFLTVLGGTLMQLLIPFSVFLYAHINRSKITAQISLFWLGMNWIDSAIYCADAYYQNLPLIGNLPKSSHDYLNLLSSLNILDKYMTVAWLMFSVAILCFIGSLIYPLFVRKLYDYVDLENELQRSGLM